MILSEKNYENIIDSYNKRIWQPVLNLIPEIEKLLGKNADFDEIFLDNFNSIISNKTPIKIDFKWSKWDEGKKILSDKNFDFNSIDIPTKCKIITALIRNDRFCEGVLKESFKSGLILKILISIKEQLSD